MEINDTPVEHSTGLHFLSLHAYSPGADEAIYLMPTTRELSPLNNFGGCRTDR